MYDITTYSDGRNLQANVQFVDKSDAYYIIDSTSVTTPVKVDGSKMGQMERQGSQKEGQCPTFFDPFFQTTPLITVVVKKMGQNGSKMGQTRGSNFGAFDTFWLLTRKAHCAIIMGIDGAISPRYNRIINN